MNKYKFRLVLRNIFVLFLIVASILLVLFGTNKTLISVALLEAMDFSSGYTILFGIIIIFLILIIWFNALKTISYFIISFFGVKKYTRDYPLIAPNKKFEIIIPACNEESVIQATIEALLNIDYCQPKYKITVIADNCHDQTAEIVKQYPVKLFVTNSIEGEPKGKPHAIKKYIATKEWEWADYVIILDADNIIDQQYLTEMNSQLSADDTIVCSQGYLGVKNVESSFIASGYAAAYFNANRIYQLAKKRLGWNTTIGGTGFALSAEYIKQHGWNPKSYTEDFELQVELSLQGLKTTWNHLAIVYDEKPNHFKASNKQRMRWAQGHWFVGISTTPQQIKSIFTSKNFVTLLSRIETFFYSYTMISLHIVMFILVMLLLEHKTFLFISPLYSFILVWLVLDICRFLLLPVFTIYSEGQKYIKAKATTGKKIFFVMKLCIALIVNSLVYTVIQYLALFIAFRPQNSWVKTQHSVQWDNTTEKI